MYLSDLRVYFKVEVYFRVKSLKNQWIMPTLLRLNLLLTPGLSSMVD